MYIVRCDGTQIYRPGTDDLELIDPTLELELNSPGSFTFTMLKTHPYYDLPKKMLSRVQVLQDNDELFVGRITDEKVDFNGRKTLYCEGELAFLNDSIQRPAEYHNISVYEYLKALIDYHNEQVEEDKQFTLGAVSVHDTNDSLYRYTNYNTTMAEIKEDLVDDLGGYLRVRNQDGVRYLDYMELDEYGNASEQVIRFGQNLLDYTSDIDVTDIATVIIPLGEKLEESPIEALDMRLTIESVNEGLDYLEAPEAIENLGRVTKTVIWDDVTQASNLKSKGEQYLTDTQWENMTLEVSAIDMHYTESDTEALRLGDRIRVISGPHGLDRWFPLSKMTLQLDQLQNNTFTLGTTVSTSLSSSVANASKTAQEAKEDITPMQVVLANAKTQATELINAATHGYVVMQPNDSPEEILIMDTPDISTAQRLWRWNLNGLGYSNTGYEGKFGLAMTIDGSIVADYVNTGKLNADIIQAGTIRDTEDSSYWNLETGDLSISGKITASSGKIGGWTISGTKIYGGGSVENGGDGNYDKVAAIQIPREGMTWVFAAGGEYHSSYGDCPFRVSRDGKMYATSGEIGGWTISSSKLYSGDEESGVVAVQTPSSDPNTTRNVFAAGGDTHSSYTNCPFRVTQNGTLYATKAHITGAITATSGSFTGSIDASDGYIGGWQIKSKKIMGGTKSTGVAAVQIPDSSSTGGRTVFAAGGTTHDDYGDCPFRVTQNGTLYASKGTFSGSLDAATGTFSGSLSAASGTFKGSLSSASGSYTGTITITNGNYICNLSSGRLYYYHGSISTSNLAGYLSGESHNSSDSYYGLRLASHGRLVILCPAISVGDYYTPGSTASTTKSSTADVKVVTSVSSSSYSYTTLHFVHGIYTGKG